MEITYSSTRSDQWRCNLYVLFHRPQPGFTLLALIIVSAACHAWLSRSSSGALGRWTFLAVLLISVLIDVSSHALLLHAMIVKRLPTPTSTRICSTSIYPELFRDVTPDKTMDYAWTQITDIRLHKSDFYFWLGGTKGNFIPGSAFDDRRGAQLFFETAVQHWRAAKSGHLAAFPSRDGVWPPAPRL